MSSEKFQRSLTDKDGTMKLNQWGRLKNKLDSALEFISQIPGIVILNCHSKSSTTDTGVTITMDAEPIATAMENLAVGALQRATTATGETLVARKASADDEMPTYYNEDGTPATKADGQPYTTEDLVALTLVFEG